MISNSQSIRVATNAKIVANTARICGNATKSYTDHASTARKDGSEIQLDVFVAQPVSTDAIFLELTRAFPSSSIYYLRVPAMGHFYSIKIGGRN